MELSGVSVLLGVVCFGVGLALLVARGDMGETRVMGFITTKSPGAFLLVIGLLVLGGTGLRALILGATASAASPGASSPSPGPVGVVPRPPAPHPEPGDPDCHASLSTDSRNCGRCAHDCLGGRCETGVCQPVILARGLRRPISFDRDGKYIYWLDQGTPDGHDGALKRMPLGGGPSDLLASGLPAPQGMTVALDKGWIYWSGADGVVRRTSKQSGVSEPLASGEQSPGRIIADLGNLYWVTREGGEIRMLSKEGGQPVTLAGQQVHPERLTFDGSSLFWVNRGSSHEASDGTIMALRMADRSVRSLALGQAAPVAISRDDDSVYWTNEGAHGDQDGAVLKVAKAGNASPVILAAGQARPTGISVDGPYVYWTLDVAQGAIMRATTDGKDAVVVAASQDHPHIIAVTDNAVMWANLSSSDSGGELVRLAK